MVLVRGSYTIYRPPLYIVPFYVYAGGDDIWRVDCRKGKKRGYVTTWKYAVELYLIT
jgi:hypothetical protein